MSGAQGTLPTGRNPLVLVVDNNTQTGQHISDCLQPMGYDTATVNSAEAPDALRNTPYQIVMINAESVRLRDMEKIAGLSYSNKALKGLCTFYPSGLSPLAHKTWTGQTRRLYFTVGREILADPADVIAGMARMVVQI
jgi:hypothetical protein